MRATWWYLLLGTTFSLLLAACVDGPDLVWAAEAAQAAGAKGGLMRYVNIALTLGLAITGPVVWARTTKRFARVGWIRPRTHVWIHRVLGLAYIPLILLWDFYLEGGVGGGGDALEGLNSILLIVILATALVLFLKKPRGLLRYYYAIKYVHIATASIYIVKFFAEPFFGGKLG